MIRRAFRHIVGHSALDCTFLADRYSDRGGWSWEKSESWVGRILDGRVHLQLGHVGWVTDIWESPTGRVFATEDTRRLVRPRQQAWCGITSSEGYSGVWGLSEDLVVAWGGKGKGARMLRWDG